MKYPIFKPHIDINLAIKNIRSVLESGLLNEGIQVKLFKQELDKYFKCNTLLLNNYTSSLFLALKLTNIQEGDEVITNPFTCIETSSTISSCGAKIVWADMDYNTGNISVDSIKEKISKKTKAIVATNKMGVPCELHKIEKLCKRYDIKYIQDSSQSFGAKYKNKHVCHYGDFTCYSLQAIKHITSGDGGVLVCKNKKDYKKANKLKWFGIDRDSRSSDNIKGQGGLIDIAEPGYKFCMENISAAIGLSQTKYIKKIINKFKKNGLFYDSLFKNNSKTQVLKYKNSIPVFYTYTLLLKKTSIRDILIQELNKLGIGACVVHYPNNNYHCYNKNASKLPKTEKFYKNHISLPCGWWLNKKDVEYIFENVSRIINEL